MTADSPIGNPTPGEEAAVRRAFAGLEEMSEAWAQEVNLTAMVAAVADKDDREGRIEALLHLAFQEGLYRGSISGADRIGHLEAVLRHIHTMDCYTRPGEEQPHTLMMRLAGEPLPNG